MNSHSFSINEFFCFNSTSWLRPSPASNALTIKFPSSFTESNRALSDDDEDEPEQPFYILK